VKLIRQVVHELHCGSPIVHRRFELRLAIALRGWRNDLLVAQSGWLTEPNTWWSCCRVALLCVRRFGEASRGIGVLSEQIQNDGHAHVHGERARERDRDAQEMRYVQ
jgi:hypothetical protein